MIADIPASDCDLRSASSLSAFLWAFVLGTRLRRFCDSGAVKVTFPDNCRSLGLVVTSLTRYWSMWDRSPPIYTGNRCICLHVKILRSVAHMMDFLAIDRFFLVIYNPFNKNIDQAFVKKVVLSRWISSRSLIFSPHNNVELETLSDLP